MCDQTEVSYLPDDVVWVKLGPVWWPGRVCKEEEIPPEIIKDLRKTPIAIVKFFQEDSFEYVKKLSNIYHYNCLRKNEFIKKGLDVLRSKNRDAPTNMKLFPEDIAKAEYLTGGDPNILENDTFLPEEKPTYADLFGTNKKNPKKLKSEVKKKPQVQQSAPRLVTHPRFLRLSTGHSTDYEARERKQEPLRAECDEEDNSPPTTYRCTDCDYTTTRLNVMVWHNKSHTHNYPSTIGSNKTTKRKSTASMKFKLRPTSNIKSVDEDPIKAKVPKTNGSMKERVPKTPGRSPKTPGRKKLSSVTLNVMGDASTNTKENKDTSTGKMTPKMHRPRRHSAPKTDEFQKSLLEDWPEDEIEQEGEVENVEDVDSSLPAEAQEDKLSGHDSSSMDTSTKDKSCFDFDDSEDHLVIDKSKFKLGRKIPRILNEVKSGKEETLVDDDAPVKLETMEVDQTNIPKYHSGVDTVTDEHCLNETQNQLQEMGVDNEIEINTEETSGEDSSESVLVESCKQETDVKAESKIEDAAEFCDKVDKLLAEVSTPSKLPSIPRLHKKAHLKAYCENLENQSRQPQTEQQCMEEEIPLEMRDIEVSSIPLPPSQPRVTSSPCTETYVENNGTNLSSDSPVLLVPSTSDQMEKNEILVAENVEISDKNSTILESDDRSAIESIIPAQIITDENNVVDVSSQSEVAGCTTPNTPTQRPALKFTTTPKLKQINTSQLLKSGQRTFKIINSTDVNFKSLINKLNASPKNQLSSNKAASSDQIETIKTVLKTSSGKSIVCNLAAQPQKVLLANSQASGSPPKFIFLNRPKSATPTAAATSTTATSTVSRTIDLTNATTVRLTPNILQKSPQKSSAAVAAAAALSKSSGKNIVLDVGTFQSLIQSSQTCAKPSQIVLPDVLVECTPQATVQLNAANTEVPPVDSQPAVMYVGDDVAETQNATSTAIGHVAATAATSTSQTIDFNYIVDDSGNLVSVSDTSMLSKDKDILAKALENTDGLQTEMALSNGSSSVLDSCSVAQNTEMTYKRDTVYENLTMSTPPIMSAYETPSRTINTAAISESISSDPTMVVRSSTTNAEYIT